MSSRKAGREIESAMDREDWECARKLILRAMEKEPDSHWLRTRLGTTYYEQRRYAEALRHFRQARKLSPACPLVNWDYAGALEALGKHRQALRIYLGLIKKGPRRLGSMDPCGEGFSRALGLVTDCLYSAALCWQGLDKKPTALRWFQAFLRARSRCRSSIYSPADALRHIEKLSNGKGKSFEQELGAITRDLLALDAKSA
jgi:tetratricopeptide (TPR) repeat protein